jgi:hypothetical protein
MVGELHSLGGKPVDMRCPETLLSITTEIPVPQIISKNVDDVWLLRLSPGFVPSEQKRTYQKEKNAD